MLVLLLPSLLFCIHTMPSRLSTTGSLPSLKYTYQLQITVKVEHHWTTQLDHSDNMFLMDEFIKYNFSSQQMRHVNNCRIFLQVILLSDITTADGRRFLPMIHKGLKPADRTSVLHWLQQENPLEMAWGLWWPALEHLSTDHKLKIPLGAWLCASHQRWNWFKETNSDVVYQHSENNTWLLYSPVSSPIAGVRRTRQYTCRTKYFDLNTHDSVWRLPFPYYFFIRNLALQESHPQCLNSHYNLFEIYLQLIMH